MTSSHEPRLDARSGFTLLEVLISTLLLSLMVSMVVPSTTFLSQSGEVMVSHLEQDRDGRVFIELISRDLRRTTDLTFFQRDSVNSNRRLTLTTIEADGSTATIEYRYRQRTDHVDRRVNGGTRERILEDVTAFSFGFFNSSGATTTTAADIKMVSVNFTFRDSVIDQNIEESMESANIVLRNRAVN